MTADTWRAQIAEAIDEHRLRTPVQCTCRWRETDSDTDTWAEHVADVVMPILEAALKQQAIDIEWAFRIRFSPDQILTGATARDIVRNAGSQP